MISNLDPSTVDRSPLRRRRYLKITIKRIETGKRLSDDRRGMGCDPDQPQVANPRDRVDNLLFCRAEGSQLVFECSVRRGPDGRSAADCRLIGAGSVENESK